MIDTPAPDDEQIEADKREAAKSDAARLDQGWHDPRFSDVAAPVVGAISHPSVAAIVPADPGGRAGPDVPTMMVHAKDHFSDKQLDPIQIPAREAVIQPIPKIVNPHADPSVRTSAQEQLERSEQNEREGMPNWPMNNDDTRRSVPGVGFNPAPKGSS